MSTSLGHRAAPASGSATALPDWEVIAAAPKELFIGGRWTEAASALRLAVEDPATGQALCEVADGGRRDARAALDAAAEAQPAWAAGAPRERARMLQRAAGILEEEAERFALLLTLEMGKPLVESRAEVAFAAEYLEWFAEEAVRIAGRSATSPDGAARLLVARRPVGPTLVVAPWNFPLAVPARGLAAALAAGCATILRPSALTPLSSLALAKVLALAGSPPGVVNVVVSSEDRATDLLLGDRRLRKLTFTGSPAVGRHLCGLAAERPMRVTAELGGQAPFVVFEDADLDRAVADAVAAKLRNGGQACTAANRFLVQAPIADEFSTRLATTMGALRLGRGTDPGVDLGPLVGARQRDRLTALVADAVQLGARSLLHGGPRPGPGNFFAPVLLADVPARARVVAEEVFGPVASVAAFESEAEVLAAVATDELGLAAYIHTRDLDRALRVAEALDVGMVAVNSGQVSSAAAPFGGVKGSGFGRSGGVEGIDEYLDTAYVAVACG